MLSMDQALRGIALAVTGITDLPKDEQQAAVAEFGEGALTAMLTVATNTFLVWGASAGSDIKHTRNLTTAALGAVATFAVPDGDPETMRELFLGTRDEAMTRL
ncbi:hypothetical protein, partial [Streptomyces sp. NRRL WC-3742]|uniref:hypothetical protein n=1 Tax=Streptomyces sp. NRRL WC-3742 TaxID=1463934 RepID=UPI0004CA843C